jgi:hypothetical protein
MLINWELRMMPKNVVALNKKTTDSTLRELTLLASSAEIWTNYQKNAGKLPAPKPN